MNRQACNGRAEIIVVNKIETYNLLIIFVFDIYFKNHEISLRMPVGFFISSVFFISSLFGLFHFCQHKHYFKANLILIKALSTSVCSLFRDLNYVSTKLFSICFTIEFFFEEDSKNEGIMLACLIIF